MKGLAELLAWLHQEHFRIAIASSSRPEQVNLIIKNLKLDHYFDAIVGNDGSMKPKPAPDVYLLALKQIGADAAHTLALEDSSSGVQAAHNAELFVIAVPNGFTQHQDFSHANCVMQDLYEVRSFLGEH
jgi:HAD superfamily hydrolase (TIGR01509 family)